MVFNHILPKDMGDLTEEEGNNFAQMPAIIGKYYIQDLYRFFKLYPLKNQFHDFFQDTLMLHENPILKPLLYRAEYIRQVADFLFKTEKFEMALNIYHELEYSKAIDKDVLQRIGYCYERINKDYTSAAYYYIQANDMAPGSVWTLRRLATCYRHKRLFDKAKDCYQELMMIEPDNLSYSYNLGACLIDLGEYDEALQCFYKMDLAEDDNIKAWRGIVWCCFKSGKLEKAQQYCIKIINLQPDANDWLNAGHVAWCQGNLPQAVEYYQQGARVASSPFAFRKLLQQDYQLLQQKGISQTDFILMMELI
jgi:tetratricopeptide (TPR) repeat protein